MIPRNYCQAMRQILGKMSLIDKTSKFYDFGKERPEEEARIGIPILLQGRSEQQHSSADELEEFLRRELLSLPQSTKTTRVSLPKDKSEAEGGVDGDDDLQSKVVEILEFSHNLIGGAAFNKKKKKETASEAIARRSREVSAGYNRPSNGRP